MKNSKQILLISYTFPPYPGIGGRRWAKFSKYLSRLGYVVYVVHAKNPFHENSLWLNDIENDENIKRYQLNSSYPKILLTQPKSIFEKLKYKISLFLVKMFSKGTPYDKGIFWKRQMLKSSVELIKKHQIKNVIVSCAPFSSAFFCLELKKQFNDLNLLVDFRDPWTWGSGYGFSLLTPNRIKYEKMMEASVVKFSDRIFVPSIEMKSHIVLNYPKYKDKITLLPHGFDEDEISLKPKKSSDKLRLVLSGTLYINLDTIFEAISLFIINSQNKISLDIYSSNSTYKNIFETYKLIPKSVNYLTPILPKCLFEKYDEFDYVLIIQPDYAKDFITTKIYEIIYSGTPILLVSNEGKLSKFISENELGLCFTPKNFSEKANSIFEYNDNTFRINQFKIGDYSFKFITSNLINFLK